MTTPIKTSGRLELVDALRGFAIVSIMLLHNLEHFDLYYFPAGLPGWLVALDKVIWNVTFFLFAGKSHAIFALLFGLTFYIQLSGREQRGEDFRPRFAWRLLLLMGFGLVNSTFYQGDILSMYAVLGLVLIPVARLGNRTLLLIAACLALQPWSWFELLAALPHPAAKLPDPASWALFGRADSYLSKGSLLDAWIGNLTNGKAAIWLWSWENGRLFEIPALFMLGMLAGRTHLFALTDTNRRFWKRLLLAAIVLFLPLFFADKNLGAWTSYDTIRRPLGTILEAWSNLAFTALLVSSFALLYQSALGARWLGIFRPLGRMSLTSYMMQSLMGTLLYYGFSLGMYRYTGATYSLLIGFALSLVQLAFSRWWLREHRQGPLEAIWHRLTWLRASSGVARQPG
jgi:uncharacterized protein